MISSRVVFKETFKTQGISEHYRQEISHNRKN